MSNSDESEAIPEGEGKIQRSVDSMLKQMEVTTEEKKYREENFDDVDLIKDHVNFLVCTRCDLNFVSAIKKGKKISVHPLLGVLMCDKCCDYFGDGDFSLDSEGEDKYCRWCGDGGTIFVCSKCNCGFCDACIKKHFGENELKEVKVNDNWTCYFCNPKPLWYLRSLSFLAKEAAKSKMDQAKDRKEGRTFKKKRRKKGTDVNDASKDSSVTCGSDDSSSNNCSHKKIKRRSSSRNLENVKESGTNDSSSNGGSNKQIKQRRSLRKLDDADDAKRDESSSNEEGKKNHINAKKRAVKIRKQSTVEDTDDESSDSSRKNSEKKLKISCDKTSEFENRKQLVIKKLISIWKLTQSVMEAGISSSREKVKFLSKRANFKTLESLRREQEDLKSCIDVLATSLNSASNSLNAITDDLTFDAAKNESENIRSLEMKLKRLAKKFQQQSNVETSLDSNGNSSRSELSDKEMSGDEEEKRSENAEKEEDGQRQPDRGGKSDSSSEDNERGKNVSASESDDEKWDAEEDGERESGKEGGPVKPLLKVKSFAKMLNDNVYDNEKQKNPVVIDLYNTDTDESESEKRKGNPEKAISRAEGKEKLSSDVKNHKSRHSEGKKAKKPESENEEKNDKKEAETLDEGEKELSDKEGKTKKNKADEIENKNEDSEESEERKQDDKKENETKREATSEDEDGKKSSGEEKEKKKKKLKESSSDDDQKSSEEQEQNTRRTRNSKKEKTELKASFEKFKRTRERFLRSAKEGGNDKEESKKVKVKALESSESESETDKKENKSKNRRLKKRVLASSDEENGEGKKEEAKSSEEESEKENQNKKSDAEATKTSKSESSSEEEVRTKRRKRIRKRMRESSDSGEDSKKKQKKAKGSSSDSSGDEGSKKRKKGRRNINKILKKDSLQVETKEALKNEEERKKRLKEKQKLFEEYFPQDEEGKTSKQLILDFDPETKEPLVTIHKKLAKKLKPHQVSGVKFMWDNCFESVQKLEEESGSGCILAHCMGLGKTLQVVTLVHTVMSHDLGVNTVLIVCPLSTVSNWIREFEMWLENVHTEPITLYDLVRYKRQEERRFHLEDWHKNGGVLVLSYDLFRNLTKTLTKRGRDRRTKAKFQMVFEKTLLDPGPDLVVCDEGHLLKNEDTALSKCMSRLKTSRRIVLTGTPLQNNLIEYHCMVQFVKPNILGTRKEFCNRFVNPINNGQFEDSTELDVKIMKRRSHVLHSMLEGCIQRFDYSVLTPFLPEKHEYVLLISLTDTQAKVYLHFIQNLSAKSSGSSRAASLFNDYHSLQRIWTHPRTLLMQKEKEDQKEALASDSEGSLKDFVVSSDEETSEPGSESSDDSKPAAVEPRKRILRSNANDPEVRKMIDEEEKAQSRNWWDEFYEETAYDDIRESNKLVLLFDLLKYCGEVKDKVLVFSQSLYSLDLIEYFLAKIDENTKKDDETLCGHQDTWVLGADYFRLDGSTNSETRSAWCKYFNKESNTRARLFLISTRAGGLGINLYGANRVVIFDASWNPSHDLQSIFRVYRFGQKKTCYIYRFLSEATMEEKIYERQVTKLSLAHRVVDEHQIERHYTMGNLQELYTFEPAPKDKRKVPNLPKDSVLADLLAKHKDVIVNYHEHDSLLENKEEEELSEEERKAAWREYEEEKVQKVFNFDLALQQQLLLMQQAQQTQTFPQMGEGPIRFINPAHLGQLVANPNFLNPMYVQQSIPMDVLHRGIQVGVAPLPKETLDAFLKRILHRESLLRKAGKQ